MEWWARVRKMRKSGIVLLSSVMLCACETVRTVYDENGNVIDPNAVPQGETDISSRLEKQFSSSFSEKKNDQGVPQAVSNKVSSFQRDLDEASRLDKEYRTGSYSGGAAGFSVMSFSGSGKAFSTQDAYSGTMGKTIEKDLHPAFASPSRGVYGTDDSYARGGVYSALEDRKSAVGGRVYSTSESVYTNDKTSGYFETRRNNTPPPPIFSRDQYNRKTIEQTRTLLGRDKDD